jgi:hypothetical protein
MGVRRGFLFMGVFLAVLGRAPESRAQVLTVTVSSAGELLTQLRTLMTATDPEGARPALDALGMFENEGFLKGFDRGKPIVATLDLLPDPQGGPVGLPAVTVFVPVTNQKDLLESLKGLGLEVGEPAQEGFSHKITPQGGSAPPVFLLDSPPAGYAVATNVPSNPAKLRAVKPESLKPTRPGALLASLRLDRVPETMRRMYLDIVKKAGDQNRQRRDGESEAQYKGRLAGQSLVADSFASLVRDGREVFAAIDVNPKRGRFSISLSVDAKPNTPTAATFASFATRKSRFRGLSHGSAVSLGGVLPITEPLRAAIRDGIKSAREDAKKQPDPDSALALIAALEPTLTGPEIDGWMLMDAAGPKEKAGANVVLFGAAIKDSKKLEASLREALTKAKPKDRQNVTLDLDRGEDGTPIHRLTGDASTLKPAEFGAPLVFFAFPEGAALVSVGENGLPVLKKALATLPKAPPASGPQVALEVLGGRFGQLTMENQEAFQQAASTAFTGENAGKDQLSMGLTGEPTAVRLTLEGDLPILRFFATAGAAQGK